MGKFCEYCQTPLQRKIYSSGLPESKSAFDKRRYCGKECGADHRAQQREEKRQANRGQWREQCKQDYLESIGGPPIMRSTVGFATCQVCNEVPGIGYHYEDFDKPETKISVCKTCHKKILKPAETPKPLGKCAICGRPDRLRKNMCSVHYRAWLRKQPPSEGGKVCSVCGERHFALGYCRKHYNKFKKGTLTV